MSEAEGSGSGHLPQLFGIQKHKRTAGYISAVRLYARSG